MPPFSNEWWIYNVTTISIIIGIVLIGKNISIKNKKYLTLGIGSLFFFEFLFMEIFHLFSGTWEIQKSLPLHLCGIMWLIAIYMFFSKKKWSFEMLLFIGMPGGLHSLLTPEFTHGSDTLHQVDFFIGHGGLVLAPFYAIFVLDMSPRKYAWLNSFLTLQGFVVFVFLTNFLINYVSFGYFFPPESNSLTANYMYLIDRPEANNPLNFGTWPYYILIFEIFMLAHAAIINLPFNLKSRIHN